MRNISLYFQLPYRRGFAGSCNPLKTVRLRGSKPLSCTLSINYPQRLAVCIMLMPHTQ
jgi:hypothetical protein